MIILFTATFLVLLLVVWNTFGWPKVDLPTTERRPTVSVLIPARNEAEVIRTTLEQVLLQKDMIEEVLVYDDHSTDGTADIVQSVARKSAPVQLIETVPLPDEGWAGKSFACWQLAMHAHGDWLLFLDADAMLRPRTIPLMLGEAQWCNLTFLSCWPGLVLEGFWEKVLMPLLNFVVFTLYPAPLAIKMDLPALGLAHGACIFVRREEYTRIGGHTRVRTAMFEDTALARLWRREGLSGLCLDGQDIVNVRMYKSFGGIWQGFMKNIYPAFKHELSFWLFLAFHFTLFVVPFVLAPVILAAGAFSPAAWGAVACVLLMRLLQAWRFRYPPWSILFHPLAEVLLIALGLTSWLRWHGRKGVEWKGRMYMGGRKRR